MQKRSSILLQWCTIILIATGLSACGKNPILETELPPCRLDVPGVNVYQGTPVPVIPTIFQHAATATPVPPPLTPVPEPDVTKQQKSIESRYAAIRRLEYEVNRWTAKNTIALDDANSTYAQITVTFLSPELIQAVYLNNLLKTNPGVSDIQSNVAGTLNQFGARNELVFFVTATVTSVNGENTTNHSLILDPDKIKLINAEDLKIRPTHDDQNLNQSVNLHQFVSGYLYYPLAVQSGNSCLQVLDPTHNTKILIEAAGITIDNASIQTQFWTIPYSPLLNAGSSSYTPDFSLPPSIFFPINPEPEELLPSKELPKDTNPLFWREFARFVWGQVTLSNY